MCDDDPGCPGRGDGESGGIGTIVLITAVTTAVTVLVNWGMDWLKNHVEVRLKRTPDEDAEQKGYQVVYLASDDEQSDDSTESEEHTEGMDKRHESN